jgi:hypothetical protein
MASTNCQHENTTIASQVDSSSALVTSLEHQKTKTRESLRESNILALEQSSSRAQPFTNCKYPGHDSNSCSWLKDSGQDTSMVRLFYSNGLYFALNISIYSNPLCIFFIKGKKKK